MKLCIKCNESKLETQFRPNKRRPDGLQVYCRSCDKDYQKEWYIKNSEVHKQRAKINNRITRQRNWDFIIDYLNHHPCVTCGEKDIIVLEFHHKRDKLYGVANLMTSTLKKIKTEIEKCDVLCANCHKRVTAKEFNWYKVV